MTYCCRFQPTLRETIFCYSGTSSKIGAVVLGDALVQLDLTSNG
jgi:hypothetical protein